MSRRYGHARFSLYLALPMERTLKVFFVFIPFSFCKKMVGEVRPANRYGFFFVCMRIYIKRMQTKKIQYARDFEIQIRFV